MNTLLKDSKNASLYKLYNIGNGKPVQLLKFIDALESVLGTIAVKNMLTMQSSNIHQTFADTTALEKDYAYKLNVIEKQGITALVLWYKNF